MSDKKEEKKLNADVEGVPVNAEEKPVEGKPAEEKKEETKVKRFSWRKIGSFLLKGAKILGAVALAVGGGAAAGATAIKIADRRSKYAELPKNNDDTPTLGSSGRYPYGETDGTGTDTTSQF